MHVYTHTIIHSYTRASAQYQQLLARATLDNWRTTSTLAPNDERQMPVSHGHTRIVQHGSLFVAM